MAAETIKGINVVIGYDVTGLSQALTEVNKRSRDIQSELRQVERLLKLDPANTDLLAQRQKLLAEAVANTSAKLNVLRSAQAQVDAQAAKGDISQGQQRAFQRELAKTEIELKRLQQGFVDSGRAAGQMDAGLDRARAGTQGLGMDADEALKKIAKWAAGLGLAYGAVRAISGVMEASDQIATLNAQTGIGIDRLQEYRYVAAMTDTDFGGLSQAIAQMTRMMSGAEAGGEAQAKAFDDMDIEIRDLVGGGLRPASEVFDEVIRYLAAMPNESERNALALQVFGRGAQDLIPMLDAGVGAIDSLSQRARDLGLVLSDEDVLAIDQFSDSLEGAKLQAQAAGARILSDLMPTLQGVLDWAMDHGPEIASALKAVGIAAAGIGAIAVIRAISDNVGWLGRFATTILTRVIPATVADTAAKTANTGATLANAAAQKSLAVAQGSAAGQIGKAAAGAAPAVAGLKGALAGAINPLTILIALAGLLVIGLITAKPKLDENAEATFRYADSLKAASKEARNLADGEESLRQQLQGTEDVYEDRQRRLADQQAARELEIAREVQRNRQKAYNEARSDLYPDQSGGGAGGGLDAAAAAAERFRLDLQILDSEWAITQAQLRDQAARVQAEEIAHLGEELERTEGRIQEINAAYEASIAATGEDSLATLKLRADLKELEAQAAATKKQMDDLAASTIAGAAAAKDFLLEGGEQAGSSGGAISPGLGAVAAVQAYYARLLGFGWDTDDALEAVRKWLSEAGIPVSAVTGAIPGLAQGGIAMVPTLALLGEGREPEAVLPLSELRRLLGGAGSGITVPVVIQNYGVDRQTAASFADRTAEAFGEVLRRSFRDQLVVQPGV